MKQSMYFTANINSKQVPEVEAYSSVGSDDEQDLSISRNWMENVEINSDSGHPGAYDVIRCDLIKKKGSKTSFQIWGADFHLDRLEQSYEVLLNHIMKGDEEFEKDIKGSSILADENYVNKARSESVSIMEALLNNMVDQRNETDFFVNGADNKLNETNTVCEILKLTLLWTPSFVGSSALTQHIVVRGHCSSTGQVIEPHTLPKPITATLALPDLLTEVISKDEIPDRHICPNAKISSWSSKRRPLEQKETFMPDGVGEVLLLQEAKDTQAFHVLEGLTSNFFVIYKDGTIRTANDGILFGYVRHLVLKVAEEHGFNVNITNPILLEEAREWDECFITSSSRLIYPIEKILTPDYAHDDVNDPGLTWKTFWKERHDDNNKKWKKIYNLILKAGGYD
jgi:hypothetical protein